METSYNQFALTVVKSLYKTLIVISACSDFVLASFM